MVDIIIVGTILEIIVWIVFLRIVVWILLLIDDVEIKFDIFYLEM